MGFTAEGSVSDLDWTFQPYVDAKGVTPEPSVDQIEAYWHGFGEMLRRNQEAVEEWNAKLDAAKSDKTKSKKIRDEYAAFQRQQSQEAVDTRRRLLAALCGEDLEHGVEGSPSLAQLEQLPGRIFDAFQANMQDALVPKALKPGTTD